MGKCLYECGVMIIYVAFLRGAYGKLHIYTIDLLIPSRLTFGRVSDFHIALELTPIW